MSKLSKDFAIELTTSVEASISHYFSDVQKIMKHYEKYLKRHRELDFLKMRRFLHTAFKTLQEIDPTFMAHKLINLWKHLERLAATYDDFCLKDKIGVHSFELIFLHQQETYTSFEGRLEHNADEITYLRQLAEKFKENVEIYKEKLANSSKSSSEYAMAENELKRIKTRENNTIVRLGELIEENEIIAQALARFKKTHEDHFFKAFKKFIYNVRPNLISVLNSMAFEFDIDLWHKAKESNVIQSYFQNANAGSVLSSKTYLKYFLKHLDQNKLSKENQELRDLYDYLNKRIGISVLLYLPDEDDAQRFRNALEADSASYEIYVASTPKTAYAALISHSITMLIVDADIENRIIEKVINTYAEKQPEKRKKTKIILVAGEIDDERIAQADQIKVDSLIERELEPIEIIDTVYSLF